METTPTHCICGSRFIEGEAEITVKGVKMLVPALICLNDSCVADLGFIVKKEVLKSAQYWAQIGERQYKGLVTLY